jgi:hypothetical protein
MPVAAATNSTTMSPPNAATASALAGLPLRCLENGYPNKLGRLDGLNLSLAWCMLGIARTLPADDPSQQVLLDSAQAHLRATLSEAASGHYEGEPWLATFAIYALSTEGP